MAVAIKRHRSCTGLTKSNDNISNSNYYNNLICNSCVCSSRQCHYKKLFDDRRQNNNLLYQTTNITLLGFPNISSTTINGIVGPSNCGKTLLLKILAGKVVPKTNTCFTDIDTMDSDYMTKIYFNEMATLFKNQKNNIKKKNMLVTGYLFTKGVSKITILQCHSCINDMLDRDVLSLSNAEAQILNIWIMCNTLADAYFFDNPFLHLNPYQCLFVASQIKKLNNDCNYVFITDNDLTMVEYLCDNLIILDYNVKRKTTQILNSVSMLDAMEESNNAPLFIVPRMKYLDPLEDGNKLFTYKECKINNITISKGFVLVYESINVIVGPSKSGKTFFMHWLKTKINLDTSIKNQYLKCPWYTGTVINILRKQIGNKMSSIQFTKQVIKPLNIQSLYNKENKKLTTQEKQLIEIVICLGKNASIYMLDNVTNYLDYKTRVNVANVIKTFTTKQKKCMVIIDNDLLFCSTVCNDMNSSCFLTKINNNNQIHIDGPDYYRKIIYLEFGAMFYNTKCARPMLI